LVEQRTKLKLLVLWLEITQQSVVVKITLRMVNLLLFLVVMPMVPMGYTALLLVDVVTMRAVKSVPLLGDHKIMQMVMAVPSLVA